MDKQTTDYRPGTRDHRLQPAVRSLRAVVCILAMLALFPVAGYAATQNSDNAGDISSEHSAALQRSIEAGKAVLKRALSNREKTSAEAEGKNGSEISAQPAAAGTSSVSANTVPAISTAKRTGAVADKINQDAQKKIASDGVMSKPLSSAEKKVGESSVKKEPMITKKISGTLSSKSSGGIGLVYGVDKKSGTELEMWLPFSKSFTFQAYQTADEIAAGDSVIVTYEETQKGGFKRSATGIKLVKKPSNEKNPYYEGETTP